MEATRTGAAVQLGNRPADYYSQARPDVAALVPPGCRRVLDVGCGAGALGALLQERGCTAVGVELCPEAAARARTRLAEVVVGDVEAQGFPFPPGSFDAIVFADVLEHFLDPWRVLREAVQVLAPDGCVVASIPNLQNADVLWRLIRGRWDYRERGLADFGHLRFFTYRTIEKLFDQAGLEIVRVEHRYRRTPLREALRRLTFGAALGYLTRQYLVVGRRRAVREADGVGCRFEPE